MDVYQLTAIDGMQRISRRVIAEQHLALTEAFHSPWHLSGAPEAALDSIGDVFLRCNAKQVIQECAGRIKQLAITKYGPNTILPEIKLEGHLDANFPYVISHLQYIIGELLRNSVQAIIESKLGLTVAPPPICILICETPQHVIIRISDQGGGIPKDELQTIFSFSKSPKSQAHLENFAQTPRVSATMQELTSSECRPAGANSKCDGKALVGSLGSLTSRSPNLRLGMGLPMSRIYAQYWAGSLEVQNLEGYGCDAFLQVSKFGNKNEQLSTRARMDAI